MEIIQCAGKRMYNCIHDIGILKNNSRRICQTDHDAGEQHVAKTFFKAITDLTGTESADYAGQDTNRKEYCRKLIDIVTINNYAMYGKDDSQNKYNQYKFLAQGHLGNIININHMLMGMGHIILIYRA